MKQSTASPRRTRTTNATKHPGLLDAPSRRRSRAEKVADDAHQSELQALQNAKALHTLDTIASVEEAMEASQQAKRSTIKNGVRPTKPRTMTVKDGVMAAVVPKGKRR
jgi:hypothetical protein